MVSRRASSCSHSCRSIADRISGPGICTRTVCCNAGAGPDRIELRDAAFLPAPVARVQCIGALRGRITRWARPSLVGCRSACPVKQPLELLVYQTCPRSPNRLPACASRMQARRCCHPGACLVPATPAARPTAVAVAARDRARGGCTPGAAAAGLLACAGDAGGPHRR